MLYPGFVDQFFWTKKEIEYWYIVNTVIVMISNIGNFVNIGNIFSTVSYVQRSFENFETPGFFKSQIFLFPKIFWDTRIVWDPRALSKFVTL